MKDKNKVFALAMFSKKAGDYVPVARKLIEAGSCCGEGCLKCPYIPKHVKGSTTVDPEAKRELEKQERGDALEGLYPGNVKSAGWRDQALKLLSLFGKGGRAAKGSGLAKMFTTPSGRKDLLLDWLIPGSIGYDGYHTAREEGMTLPSSLMMGAASWAMGSPRDYATIWRLRKTPFPIKGVRGPGKVFSPFTAFTARMLPMVGRKALFGGAGLGLDTLQSWAASHRNVKATTENLEEASKSTKGFAQTMNSAAGAANSIVERLQDIVTTDPNMRAMNRLKAYYRTYGWNTDDPKFMAMLVGKGDVDPATGKLIPLELKKYLDNAEAHPEQVKPESINHLNAVRDALRELATPPGGRKPMELPFKFPPLLPPGTIPSEIKVNAIPEGMTESVKSLSGTAEELKKLLGASKPSMLAGAGLLGGGFAGGLLADAFARRVEGPEDSRINRRRRSIGILIGSLLGGMGGLAATPEGQKAITGVPDWFSRKMLDWKK